MPPFLELRDLKKTFPLSKGLGGEAVFVRAVDGVSLAIEHGETLGLVGESGCGKSTVAKLVLRLLQPTHGELLLEGKPYSKDKTFCRAFPEKVQMIFQDPFSSLNPRQKIGKAIAEPLLVRGKSTAQQRCQRVEQLLEWVGLRAGHAKRYPHEFSGGQRQRVAIARALALNPDLVVCDEPVSALDVSIQAQVLNLLLDMQERLELTYLFISHDLSVVSHVSDRVAVMYLGRIVELAPSASLYETPLHPYTQALIDSVPSPVPPEEDVPAKGLEGEMPSPADPPAGCPFHTRCAYVLEKCSREYPVWQEKMPGHHVACHLHTKPK